MAGFVDDMNQQLPKGTDDARVLYADYLLSNHHPRSASPVVGVGEFHIVCDPQDNFLDVMTTLKEYFDERSTPDIYVCMDGVTHPVPFTKKGSDTEVNDFENKILQHVHSVVVVISLWDNIRLLRRATALLELFSAIKRNCDFHIALSLQEKKGLINRIRQCTSGSDAIAVIQETLSLDFGIEAFGNRSLTAEEAEQYMQRIKEILRTALAEKSKAREGWLACICITVELVFA